MVEIKTGNLLEEKAEALVNTVNCVGVMGKGVALQFKQAFPENYKAYYKACKSGDVKPGKMFVHTENPLFNPKFIINFPTKLHWRKKSQLEYIEKGLKDLIEVIQKYEIQSIALPPLGCGNGGLNWKDVKSLIEKTFSQNSKMKVILFEPSGSPAVDKMPVATIKPKMTIARALYLLLMDRYSEPGYLLSLLEIQKLAYFLQESGEDLKLRFKPHTYGPYAENLNHVLQVMEGHFIRGYGDRSKGQGLKGHIKIYPEAVKQAEHFIISDKDALKRLDKVSHLIYGFETPYGMELLSTVHWIVINSPEIQDNLDEIIQKMHLWNERKRRLFSNKLHISKALSRIKEDCFITS